MEISKVGVIGCGLMGHGITQISAQAGWDVVVRELNQERLDGGIGKIEKQLGRAVEKGKATQENADAARGRIHPTLDYGDLADCDLVIEAIAEDLGLKLEMWKEVDAIVKEGATFATNTSSLAVIDQAAATSRPDRFCGMHFFNPAQVMPLLEVVQTVTTSDETLELAFEVGERLGKTTVHGQDRFHRQPPARALHARRDPRLRGGRWHRRPDRRRDEGGRQPPDGPVHAARLRGP